MDLNAAAIKNIIFPMLKYAKNNKTLDYLADLNRTQFLPTDEIINIQREKLRKLLLHCVNNVPAYQAYKEIIPLIEKDPFEALSHFPILTKQQVNEMQDIFIFPGADKSKLIPNRSGGSTGQPVRFYIDRPTSEHSEAARWRALSWWDISIGDKCLMVWGNPLELSNHEKLIYNMKERFLKNIIFVSAYSLNPKSVHKYAGMINTSKPKYFYGYASALHLLAQLVIKNNVRIKHRPKVIISTAETLYDFQRETIEKAFQCRVINEYGARDAGVIAYECRNGKMHISAENMIIEIVDIETKKPLGPGESGLVIITDLNNYSMPRLRYQLGDIASLSGSTCGCGINLPLIENVQGREDDIFVSSDGKYVHAVYFCNLARSYPSIRQFQIIQKTRHDLLLKIIRNDPFNELEIMSYIKEIYKVMGHINIDVEYVDAIEPAASGKIRYSKREFPLIV
ncbi:MAG: phenylacetate--CoA ligase family protein [Clostridiaceae bacterium]|nr:phenylacetate--CoA ligase family protein [Clostridiaceae bacterium]